MRVSLEVERVRNARGQAQYLAERRPKPDLVAIRELAEKQGRGNPTKTWAAFKLLVVRVYRGELPELSL